MSTHTHVTARPTNLDQCLILPFSPHYLIHYTCIAMNDLHDLRRHVLIHIIRHRQAFVAVKIHLHSLSTACSRLFSSMPARTKQPLSSASGRSVLVLMHTAGNECHTLVKKLLSSGSVPKSETTVKAFICRQLQS